MDENKAERLGMTLYKPTVDKDLRYYIDQVKDMYLNLPPQEQAVKLAEFVSDKMGGPVGRDEIVNLGYELAINETKYELKTNIIPLGKIVLGTYYHRALLFKVQLYKIIFIIFGILIIKLDFFSYRYWLIN